MVGNKKIVAYCTSDVRNEDEFYLTYHLQKVFEEHGWKMFIYNVESDLYNWNPFDQGEANIFQLINYEYIDAVIVHEPKIKHWDIVQEIIEKTNQANKPVFLLNSEHDREHVIDIMCDEGNAFRDLVMHLIEKHNVKRFGLIAGLENNAISDKKVKIFRQVLKDKNIEFDERFFGYGDFWARPTTKVLDSFFEIDAPMPEAIVCINDSMAITTCEYLIDRGISVPEDIIVTGFDGTIQGRNNFPKITTCHLNYEKYAGFVVDLLDKAFEGNALAEKYFYPFVFSPAESCGCETFSKASLNKVLNDLSAMGFMRAAYERSMTNMLSKITNLSDLEGLDEIMRYYLKHDTYLCLNFAMGDEQSGEIQSDSEQAFEQELFVYKYFQENEAITNQENTNQKITNQVIASKVVTDEEKNYFAKMEFGNMIPNIEIVADKSGPVLFSIIHNQQDIYGYMVTLFESMEEKLFSQEIRKVERFKANLDASLTLFMQQNSLRKTNKTLIEVQNRIISGFAELVESRDDSTGHHIKRTGEYIRILAKKMSTYPEYQDILDKAERELIYKAAPLHDIGKVKISDTILNKPARLTDEEFAVIKTHSTEGSKIIQEIMTDIEAPEYVKVANDMALYHHEKWDGSGYPCHLSGEEIPLCARLMAVVDVFDALSSKRVYKQAYSMDKTFQIIEESSGTHFDPRVVKAFLEVRSEIEDLFMRLD